MANTHRVHYVSSSFIYSNNYGASVTYRDIDELRLDLVLKYLGV